MPAYDAGLFDPPAPVAPVVLRNPTNGVVVHDVRMLIDSGADVTLIPAQVVEQLDLRTDGSTVHNCPALPSV